MKTVSSSTPWPCHFLVHEMVMLHHIKHVNVHFLSQILTMVAIKITNNNLKKKNNHTEHSHVKYQTIQTIVY